MGGHRGRRHNTAAEKNGGGAQNQGNSHSGVHARGNSTTARRWAGIVRRGQGGGLGEGELLRYWSGG